MNEQPNTRPNPLSKRKGRTMIVVFFAVIALATWFLTRGLGPLIVKVKYDASTQLHFYKVTEVISGDTLRVESNRTRSKRRPKKTDTFPWVKMEIVSPGSNEVIRVQGILAPPLPESPEANTFISQTGVPQSELAFLSDISRKALVILLHKQLVDLEFTGQTSKHSGEVVRQAFVRKSGVDVAFKQITGCQALVVESEHRWQEKYRELEAEARAERLGIWKYLPDN